MNLKVKICGITNLNDALAAVDAGADALGFVFCEASPRHITPESAADIIRELPPFVTAVGLFVNATEETVRETAERCGVHALQFHGEEPPSFCRKFKQKVIKAFRIRDESSLAQLSQYTPDAWLLDSFVEGQHGGAGQSFNWTLAQRARPFCPRLILAGGLTPANVAEAVLQVSPYAVDVSSGVESAPGKKDAAKVRDFIQAAKGARVTHGP